MRAYFAFLKLADSNAFRFKLPVSVAAILLGAASFAQNVSGPSFDCKDAERPDEFAICSDPYLSLLDSTMAQGYIFLKGKIGQEAARNIARPRLEARHACESDINCIENNLVMLIEDFIQNGAPIYIPPETSTRASIPPQMTSEAQPSLESPQQDYITLGNSVLSLDNLNFTPWLDLGELTEAAQSGDLRAKNNLAVLKLAGSISNRENDNLVNLLSEAAEGGNIVAMYNLALLVTDYEQSEKWFQKSADAGFAPAQYRLAQAFANDYPLPDFSLDPNQALDWARKAAMQGYAEAQDYLGWLLISNLRDYTDGLKWVEAAAKQGFSEAEYKLGFMYFNGTGVNRNDSEAEKWYRRASEHGHSSAMYELSQLLAARDPREAGEWMDKWGNAENLVGADSHKLDGYFLFSKESDSAVRFVNFAHKSLQLANAGDPHAQVLAGNIYEIGAIYGKNEEYAFAWYMKSADQGLARAQVKVGEYLRDGRGGVEANKIEAAKWFQKAADQGYAVDDVNLLGLSDPLAYRIKNLAVNYATVMSAKGKGVEIFKLSLDMGPEKIVNDLQSRGFNCSPRKELDQFYLPDRGKKNSIDCVSESGSVVLNQSGVAFSCNIFNVCAYSNDELAKMVVDQGIVPELSPKAVGNGEYYYWGRAAGGDELSVIGTTIRITFGSLGQDEVNFN